jgi:mRNA-degrading endonuclease HigB of HigAB toxin-antitoxin module
VLAVILLLLLVAGAGGWYLTAGQQESRYGNATAVRQSGVLAPGTYAELAAAGKKVLGADETHTYPGDVEITVSGLTAFTPADEHLAQNVRGVAYKVTVAIAYHGEEEPLSALRIPILAFGGGGDEERELTQLDELRDSSVDHTLARDDRDLLWEPGETKTVEFAFDAPPGTTYVVITVENPSTYRRTAGDWRLS